MHRTILKWHWRTVRGFVSGPVLPKRGNVIGPHLVESFQTIAGSTDPVSFGYRGELVTLGVQIVHALQLGHRSRASSLLTELDAANHAVQIADIVRILDYCARSPDPLFVMETWRVLEQKNIHLNHKCYMLMIRALCNGGYMEEAVQLVNFLGEHQQISYILPLYNCFLSACTKMKDVIHFHQCLDLMENELLGKNEVTYAVLLKLAVWQKNLSAVHEIWREYSKYYNLNIISLRKFIWSFTRLKDLESAYNTLQYMVALAFKEGPFLYKTMEGKIRCLRLDIPIPSQRMSAVGSHLFYGHASPMPNNDETMTMNSSMALDCPFDTEGNMGRITRNMLEEHKERSIMKLLRWSFNDVIHACAQCRNSELAEQLVMQMRNLGLEPSSHTFDGLIRAVIPGRAIGDTVDMLKVMHERKLEPYDSTLSTLSVSCSRALDLDLAEALLNRISQVPHAHPFNAFFAACDTMEQPERAIKMLARMRQLNIKPDARTYALLFSLFGNVNAPYEEGNLFSQAEVSKRIEVIEMDMLNNGIQHSHLSIKNLLKALGTEGMVQELLKYVHATEKQFSHHNFIGTDIYNTVLHSLVEVKENHVAIQMFRNMKLCGLQPDAATYNIMIDGCSNIRCFKSACALVSMMLRDGYHPKTLTYTALIKILLDDDAFDEALYLLDQAISEGNELDVLLFNTVLSKAGLQGRIDIVELVVELMDQEKIQPDPSTCSYVFNAYVDHKFFETAVEALQVLSMRMISKDCDTLEDVRREFEDLILADEPEAEKQIMRIFKQSENLAAALLNLRWCSIAGYSVSWVPDQSPWAKRLASSYDTKMAHTR